MPDIFCLNDSDNVAVATANLKLADEVDAIAIQSPSVPRGHKVATEPIPQGANVFKYGQIIGQATADIQAGDTFIPIIYPCQSTLRNMGLAHKRRLQTISLKPKRSIHGLPTGRWKVGTRNYVGIISR